MAGPAVFATFLIVYAVCACVTVAGSHHRGEAAAHSFGEGLAWPIAWVKWFVQDNRAAGRGWFQGHERPTQPE